MEDRLKIIIIIIIIIIVVVVIVIVGLVLFLFLQTLYGRKLQLGKTYGLHGEGRVKGLDLSTVDAFTSDVTFFRPEATSHEKKIPLLSGLSKKGKLCFHVCPHKMYKVKK